MYSPLSSTVMATRRRTAASPPALQPDVTLVEIMCLPVATIRLYLNQYHMVQSGNKSTMAQRLHNHLQGQLPPVNANEPDAHQEEDTDESEEEESHPDNEDEEGEESHQDSEDKEGEEGEESHQDSEDEEGEEGEESHQDSEDEEGEESHQDFEDEEGEEGEESLQDSEDEEGEEGEESHQDSEDKESHQDSGSNCEGDSESSQGEALERDTMPAAPYTSAQQKALTEAIKSAMASRKRPRPH